LSGIIITTVRFERDYVQYVDLTVIFNVHQ